MPSATSSSHVNESCRAGASPADPGNGKRERLPYKVPFTRRSFQGSGSKAGFEPDTDSRTQRSDAIPINSYRK